MDFNYLFINENESYLYIEEANQFLCSDLLACSELYLSHTYPEWHSSTTAYMFRKFKKCKNPNPRRLFKFLQKYTTICRNDMIKQVHNEYSCRYAIYGPLWDQMMDLQENLTTRAHVPYIYLKQQRKTISTPISRWLDDISSIYSCEHMIPVSLKCSTDRQKNSRSFTYNLNTKFNVNEDMYDKTKFEVCQSSLMGINNPGLSPIGNILTPFGVSNILRMSFYNAKYIKMKITIMELFSLLIARDQSLPLPPPEPPPKQDYICTMEISTKQFLITCTTSRVPLSCCCNCHKIYYNAIVKPSSPYPLVYNSDGSPSLFRVTLRNYFGLSSNIYVTLLTIVGTSVFIPQPLHTVLKVKKISFMMNYFMFGSSNVNKDIDTSIGQDTIEGSLRLSYPPILLFGRGHDNELSNLDTSQNKKTLGSKGANFTEMPAIGLSVPPEFTISIECCDKFCNEWDQEIPTEIWHQIFQSLTTIEDSMESGFESFDNPILLSNHRGATISMPGMKDTNLNLGMNNEVVEGLAQKSGNANFEHDINDVQVMSDQWTIDERHLRVSNVDSIWPEFLPPKLECKCETGDDISMCSAVESTVQVSYWNQLDPDEVRYLLLYFALYLIGGMGNNGRYWDVAPASVTINFVFYGVPVNDMSEETKELFEGTLTHFFNKKAATVNVNQLKILSVEVHNMSPIVPYRVLNNDENKLNESGATEVTTTVSGEYFPPPRINIKEVLLNMFDDDFSKKVDAKPNIMIPLVVKVEDFCDQATLIRETAHMVFLKRDGTSWEYTIVTMIKNSRAALIADALAGKAQFFSFGSNDLTQMIFRCSRDDIVSFLPAYLKKGKLFDDLLFTITDHRQIILTSIQKANKDCAPVEAKDDIETLLTKALKFFDVENNGDIVQTFVCGTTQNCFHAESIKQLKLDCLGAYRNPAIDIHWIVRGFVKRSEYVKLQYAAIKVQTKACRHATQQRYVEHYDYCIRLQCWICCIIAKNALIQLQRDFMATICQNTWQRVVAMVMLTIYRKVALKIRTCIGGAMKLLVFRLALNKAQEEAKLANQLTSIHRKLEEAKQRCIESEKAAEKSAHAVVIYCEMDHDKEVDKPKPTKDSADKSAPSSTTKSEALQAIAPAPAPKPKIPIKTSEQFDIDTNEFAQFFHTEVALPKSNTNHSTEKDKKQNEVKAIESKNANNGGVILAGLNMPYDDMTRAVDKIDVNTMLTEQKPGIIEFIPTKEQQKQVLLAYMIQSGVDLNDAFEQLYRLTGNVAKTRIIALDSGSSTTSFQSRQHLPRSVYLSIQQQSLHKILEAVLNIFTESMSYAWKNHAMIRQEYLSLISYLQEYFICVRNMHVYTTTVLVNLLANVPTYRLFIVEHKHWYRTVPVWRNKLFWFPLQNMQKLEFHFGMFPIYLSNIFFYMNIYVDHKVIGTVHNLIGVIIT